MALKVWLPLNEDLRNVGLENVKAEKNGSSVVFQTDTYFNKVLYFGTTNANGSVYFPPEKFTGYTAMSVSFYVNFLTFDADYSNLIGFFNSATAGDIYDANKIFSFYKHVNTTGTTAQFRFFVNLSTSNYILTNSFGTNTWQHFVLVNDDKKIILYQNGVKIGEVTFSSNIPYNGIKRVSFGQSNNTNNTRHCNAKMYDLRIYDHALTEKDVKRIYQKKIFDLIPYSGVKNVLFDKSGLCLMPLVNNNAVFQNNALYFNGTNARLRPKSGNVGFNLTGGTLSVWFTPKVIPSDYHLIFIDSTSQFGIGFYSSSSILVTSNNASNYRNAIFPATFTANTLNNVTVIYDNNYTAIKCIVNGVSVTANGSSRWYELNGLTIGGRTYNDTSLFNGKVHKVEILKEQLSVDDAIKLYNDERHMFLPNEYEELEYIQSTGTQYIDTNVKISSNNVKYNIKFQMTTASSSFCPFGTEYNNGSSNVRWGGLFYGYNKSALYIGTQAHGGKWTFTTNTDYDLSLGINNGNFTTTLNGSSISGTYNGEIINNLNVTVGLFGLNRINNNNVVTRGVYASSTKMKLYHFEIIESGIVKFNGIPAKRKSDNVIGLYDMVTRQFFTNSGTGSFTGA